MEYKPIDSVAGSIISSGTSPGIADGLQIIRRNKREREQIVKPEIKNNALDNGMSSTMLGPRS